MNLFVLTHKSSHWGNGAPWSVVLITTDESPWFLLRYPLACFFFLHVLSHKVHAVSHHCLGSCLASCHHFMCLFILFDLHKLHYIAKVHIHSSFSLYSFLFLILLWRCHTVPHPYLHNTPALMFAYCLRQWPNISLSGHFQGSTLCQSGRERWRPSRCAEL